jgi:hypothetical protein
LITTAQYELHSVLGSLRCLIFIAIDKLEAICPQFMTIFMFCWCGFICKSTLAHYLLNSIKLPLSDKIVLTDCKIDYAHDSTRFGNYCIHLTCKGQRGVLAHCNARGNLLFFAIHTTQMQKCGLVCPPKVHQDLALQLQLCICKRRK